MTAPGRAGGPGGGEAAVDGELLALLAETIAPLPGPTGGIVAVVATAGVPPAMAVLSSGDLAMVDGELWIGVHATSSVAQRVGEGCTVLVPRRDVALRVEVAPVRVKVGAVLAAIAGPIVSIRPTGEPPWHMAATFAPAAGADVTDFIRFWSEVRTWLEAGAPGDGPALPRHRAGHSDG